MFDPTVFDNLKVGFENHLYDLDNLAGQIRITGRTDRLELSVMGREFAVLFALTGNDGIQAEIRLVAPLKELAAEILEIPGKTPGCELSVRFLLEVEDPASQCEQIRQVVERIWQPDIPPVQTLSFVYGTEPAVYRNTVEIRFARQIDEEQMGDIPELVRHVLLTLTELGPMTQNRQG
ncbi:hypothetical protein E5161_09305 [Cohnella pontilimi]|uniref:Uncharacterized protein n=1 Tax=Cohnella pontilimi TaxID=2564100 RepID=A0A4U0FBI5_9BACL|nr:hypothetical protein [Cohnella pontilimi]TJY42196.1 hypothetical protein E5161_09305 [Cohnella pontilimi]